MRKIVIILRIVRTKAKLLLSLRVLAKMIIVRKKKLLLKSKIAVYFIYYFSWWKTCFRKVLREEIHTIIFLHICATNMILLVRNLQKVIVKPWK